MIIRTIIITFSICFLPRKCITEYHNFNSEIHDAKSTGNNSVRGSLAYPGQLPYVVIFYENNPRSTILGDFLSPICSGAIISSRWVLTTAVPLGHYTIGTYFMLAGVTVIVRYPEIVKNYTQNIYNTDIMIIHPDWQERHFNDLGMVRTSRDIVFGDEIGTFRIAHSFNPPNHTNLICKMNIWAIDIENVEHLMSQHQSVKISKQVIRFRVANGPVVCRDIIFNNKTLCVLQEDKNKRKDVCLVNYGALIQCSCGVVGLFNGFKGELDCVDLPPERYTAVNLPEYRNWIMSINLAPIPKIFKTEIISGSFYSRFSIKLMMLQLFLSFLIFL